MQKSQFYLQFGIDIHPFPLTFQNQSYSPILKQKSNLLSQNWYFFSLSSAKYGNSNLGFVLPDKKRKKKSKVGSYGKIEEIFITALAAQTTQKAESCTTKKINAGLGI